MKVYKFLSRLPFVERQYALKFFIISLPLLLLGGMELIIMNLAATGVIHMSITWVAVLVVVLTIVLGTFTLLMFQRLLAPLRLARHGLDDYLATGELPALPAAYTDEAGLLMAEIQTAVTQMDTLLREKSDMIDLLSHDLRSPVGRIMSLSNLIKIDDSTDRRVYADYISNECKGLLRMLENILLMLKEDSHAFRLERISLKQLVQETAGFFDFAIAEKNLALKIAVDDSICIFVQQDLFTQAVRNIIGNAIKFSPDGKTICISGKQELDQVSLSVQDEGLGFRPKDIQSIFERFTAAGKKGTHGESSVGLGLYLSKKIVEKHGGRLLAESEGLNRGASFTILLHQLITNKKQGKAVASREQEEDEHLPKVA